MEFIKVNTDEEVMIYVNDRLKYKENVENLKSASSHSHLNTAAMECRVQGNYTRPNYHIYKLIDNNTVKGMFFLSKTSRPPCHWTLNHVVVFEEYRGEGLGRIILNQIFSFIYDNSIDDDRWLRMFSDKKSIKFYERLGFEWIGLSKSGLPFTFLKIFDKDVEKSIKMFKNERDVLYNNTVIRKKLEKQFKRFTEVYYTFESNNININKFFKET